MDRIGVRELRQHASRYLAQVQQGESVQITDRGTLVAMLVPPSADQSRRERLIAAGWLIPAASSFTGHRRTPQPVPPLPDAPSNQELLDIERHERL